MLITYHPNHRTHLYDALYATSLVPVESDTTTRTINVPDRSIRYNEENYNRYINKLDTLLNIPVSERIEDTYDTFYIPKRSGNGLRRIDAPQETTKTVQRAIVAALYDDAKVLLHNNAYAYIKGRCTKDMLIAHQKNESKWFLKIDLKDFFPSCTLNVIRDSLKHIFPIGVADFEKLMELIERWCLYEGSLPQGAVTSPLLSNLVMLPYDHVINHTLKDFDGHNFVYTRYADDIIISCKYHFNKDAVINMLTNLLQPFIIKTEKTRYGSSAGRNWNLGLMLNKDNNITVGHKQKQNFKAMLFNLFKNFTDPNAELWDTHDVAVIAGLYSYYNNIEHEYITFVVHRLEEKFNVTLKEIFKEYMA